MDSEYGRYLADYSGKGELDAHALGLGDWTPFGYFQDGAIGFKSCELPVGTPGRPVCSPGARFGDSPALITPYQTAATNPERFETVTIGGITALVQNRAQMADPVAWIQALYPTTPFTFCSALITVRSCDTSLQLNVNTLRALPSSSARQFASLMLML